MRNLGILTPNLVYEILRDSLHCSVKRIIQIIESDIFHETDHGS